MDFIILRKLLTKKKKKGGEREKKSILQSEGKRPYVKGNFANAFPLK